MRANHKPLAQPAQRDDVTAVLPRKDHPRREAPPGLTSDPVKGSLRGPPTICMVPHGLGPHYRPGQQISDSTRTPLDRATVSVTVRTAVATSTPDTPAAPDAGAARTIRIHTQRATAPEARSVLIPQPPAALPCPVDTTGHSQAGRPPFAIALTACSRAEVKLVATLAPLIGGHSDCSDAN